ncbi:MAG: NAD-dependent epimerase/dehydratase family protein [Propionibacteriales bacterium]|nr:NAD-dependent epimerase/dehydratase family protein [Propionibacteriales bacterium]
MTKIDPAAPVLVTGGSGYVASWVVRYLLEDGRTVRATVRDPKKLKGLEHLHALAAEHPGRLTLHRAELMEPNSYTEPMVGCELVIHTASPFLLGKVKNPQKQLVDPALEGTRNVLASANEVGSVKRVVLTSSVVAICGDNVDMVGKDQFTEDDWNTTSTLDHQPYPFSKTVAEREAWKIVKGQDRWDLVTIHPGLVVGPSLTAASKSGTFRTMGSFTDFSLATGAPALQMGVVDVRDVARAHIAAGYTPQAHGRYITNAETMSMLDISRALRARFGWRPAFPLIEAPKPLIKLAAPVAGLTRKFVELNVGYPLKFDNSRTVKDLGIDFRPGAESVGDHFQQMIDDGIVRG